MKHLLSLITLSILTLLAFNGCGSGSSDAPAQTEAPSVYSPPQPAVSNAEERPPAVPTL